MVPQMPFNAFDCEMIAFPLLRSGVIINQVPCHDRYQEIIAQAPLHYPLLKIDAFYMPDFPTLVKVELVKAPAFKLSVHEPPV
jgi:hypothetical protein